MNKQKENGTAKVESNTEKINEKNIQFAQSALKQENDKKPVKQLPRDAGILWLEGMPE